MEGVTVFGVGVGSGFNKDEVDEIASIPKSAYAFALNDFLALSAVLQDSLINQACYVPAVVPVKLIRPNQRLIWVKTYLNAVNKSSYYNVFCNLKLQVLFQKSAIQKKIALQIFTTEVIFCIEVEANLYLIGSAF